MRARIAFLAVSASCAVLAARIQTAQTQTPEFRTGINFVRVDVTVSGKNGAFVSDLAPSDFEITEQGKPQKIETFKLVTLDGGLFPGPEGPPHAITSDADETREAARDDVRLFGIFLDDYHVSREAGLGARETIAHFISNDLGPSDMVGLMNPITPMSSVLFTRNHDAVAKAIDQFLGRQGDYEPKNTAEENVYRQNLDRPAVIEQIRNEVAFSALEGFINHLGTLGSGRKTLILVTEGFAGGLRDRPGSRGGLYLGDLYTDANRGNVSIYWVDPRRLGGLAAGYGAWLWDEQCECLVWKPGPLSLRSLTLQQDPLRALSQYTDGRAVIQRNDLSVGLREIVRDSSGYYLLGYNSTNIAADGRFHDISVHVKRPGVGVRARKGYWALSREELTAITAPAKAAPPPALERALDAVDAISHERFARSWIGMERGEGGKTRVTLVWEPTTKGPDRADPGSGQPDAIVVTATNADGDPYFRGRAGKEPVSFDVPPGTMRLRLAVEDTGADILDTETRDVQVPDFTAPLLSLATPQVFRARTTREMQQLKGAPRATPVATREFSRSDRLLVRVVVYGAGQVQPALRARLLTRAGQLMLDLAAPPPSASGLSEFEIPLASLASGDYVIDVAAEGNAGQVHELVGIHVT